MPTMTVRIVSALVALSLLSPKGGADAQEWPAGQEPKTKKEKPVSTAPRADTLVRPASLAYQQGNIHRYFLGDNYRDLWATPIRVPVLDLATYGGGLKAVKLGGGNQTRSLRLVNPQGLEYVFRPVYKEKLVLEPQFDNTIITPIFADGLSGSHPTAPMIAPPVLDAVGIPHASPELVIMPDDPSLGEFRKEVANELGTIEEYPNKPDEGPGHEGLLAVLDSDEMLEALNKNPKERIDDRLLLKARLIDFLLNDNDRHRDQWKWVRLGSGADSRWVAWPRDRDKVFVSHEGALLKLARIVRPNFVPFEGTFPDLVGLAGKVRFMDARLLADLDRSDWESVAKEVSAAVTDSVISQAVRSTPKEYGASWDELERKLRSRRDLLPAAALRYYGTLAGMVEVHATDASDVTKINRLDNGEIEVTVASETGQPYFERRFLPGETREVRVYLHGGNDSAVISGADSRAIMLRVVGGNGTNELTDATSSARLYDRGEIEGIRYKPDTAFNRRPWFKAYGKDVFPAHDYGKSTKPTVGLKSGRGLGIVPELGVERTVYGFRTWPYRSRVKVEGAYSTAIGGFGLSLQTDNRFEESRWQIRSFSEITQLAVSRYTGLGNDLPERTEPFYDVRQRQITFRPALGYGLGVHSDLMLGPVLRHSVTDSLTNRFISQERPYGFGSFGQIGAQLELDHDIRNSRSYPTAGTMTRLTARWFPQAWDVESAYGSVAAVAATYHEFKFGPRPVLAVRAGGERVFGSFPYFDAAFLGGSRTFRTAHRQQYAGDASVYGSVELRVPVAQFGFLVPWHTGAFAFSDVGRTWLDGASEGGWHSGNGVGVWLGVMNPGTSLTFAITDSKNRRLLVGTGMSF
jgi:hypothetical protein